MYRVFRLGTHNYHKTESNVDVRKNRKYILARIEEIYEIRLDRKGALQFPIKVVKEAKS